MPVRGPVALLSDFGWRDPYVAAMKGVIASRCDAVIVDLTHDIEPFDVFGAAYFLSAVHREFPEGTIFTTVVDPGVGSSRKILAAQEAARFFLAPDNGLLGLVLSTRSKVHVVENEALFLPRKSSTFHGRDRFAPLAAALACGLELAEAGASVSAADLVALDYSPPVYDRSAVQGTIVAIDRFGNCVTDIDASRLGAGTHSRLHLEIPGKGIVEHQFQTYEEAYGLTADPFLLVGSLGTLEISIARGSAADFLQIARFDSVTVQRME